MVTMRSAADDVWITYSPADDARTMHGRCTYARRRCAYDRVRRADDVRVSPGVVLLEIRQLSPVLPGAPP